MAIYYFPSCKVSSTYCKASKRLTDYIYNRFHKINRFIPLIAGVLGVGLNMWLQMSVTPLVVLTGLVSGLSSTGMYEAFEQLIKKK